MGKKGDTPKKEIGNEATQFQPGNQLWRLIKLEDIGRNPAFDSPEHMWEKATAYFEWVQANPLKEMKVFHNQGEITKTLIPKMHAMTLRGMYAHMCIDDTTWIKYRKNTAFSSIIKKVEDIIFQQKLTGAAADLLNANIIARELGLSDKTEHKVNANIGLHELTEEELDQKLRDNDLAIDRSTED